MQTTTEFRHRRFAIAAAIAALATVAACGGTDSAPGAGSNTPCTIALAASTDDAHLQQAIETALRRQDPCSLPDTPLRTTSVRASGSDLRTSYQLVRIERDEESVRAVFEAVPEMRSSNAGQ